MKFSIGSILFFLAFACSGEGTNMRSPCELGDCPVGMACVEGLCVMLPDGSATPDAFTVDAGPDAPRQDAEPSDAARLDARVDNTPCGVDEYVEANRCVSCPEGSTNTAGDDPTGADTTCDDACTEAIGIPCSVFEEAHIKAEHLQATSRFGVSVALDGDTLAVGAHLESSAAQGINGDETDESAEGSGAVFVFVRREGVWTRQAYLKAANSRAGDDFGGSVSLDGDTLSVGATRQSTGPAESGAVYVFTRNGDEWTQQAFLKAQNAITDEFFGAAVSLEGNMMAVGAPNYVGRVGTVYVFIRSGDTWNQVSALQAEESEAGSGFGYSVSLSGSSLAIGAPFERSEEITDAGAVYIFERWLGQWDQQIRLRARHRGPYHRFGTSVSMDGDLVAVGAPGDGSGATGIGGEADNNDIPNSGAAYVFQRQGTRQVVIWSMNAYIKPEHSDENDYYGSVVELDGDRLAVGSLAEASAGRGLGADPGNNDIRGAGAVYLYHLAEEAWTSELYLKAMYPAAWGRFGVSMAIDGEAVAIGAYGDRTTATGVNGLSRGGGPETGAAYIYRLPR